MDIQLKYFYGNLGEWWKVSNGEFNISDVVIVCRFGYIEILKYMFSKRPINITEKCKQYQTSCLQEACGKNRPEVLKILLQNSSKKPNEGELTIMLLACRFLVDRVEVERLLLEYGANPNALICENFSLIDQSIGVGKYETTKLLLEWGADKSKYMELYDEWKIQQEDKKVVEWRTLWGISFPLLTPWSIWNYYFSQTFLFDKINPEYRERMTKIILETEQPILRNVKHIKGARN